jgi:hypothetical protein
MRPLNRHCFRVMHCVFCFVHVAACPGGPRHPPAHGRVGLPQRLCAEDGDEHSRAQSCPASSVLKAGKRRWVALWEPSAKQALLNLGSAATTDAEQRGLALNIDVMTAGACMGASVLADGLFWVRDALMGRRHILAADKAAAAASAAGPSTAGVSSNGRAVGRQRRRDGPRTMALKWDLVDRATKAHRGELHVELGFSAEDMDNSVPRRKLKALRDGVMGVMGFRVLSGKELANRDALGKQDPYVTFQLLSFDSDGETVHAVCLQLRVRAPVRVMCVPPACFGNPSSLTAFCAL